QAPARGAAGSHRLGRPGETGGTAQVDDHLPQRRAAHALVVRRRAMTRLPTELRSDGSPVSEVPLRAFDPDRDFPAMVELITAVNHHDHVDWFPTPENLAVEWARVPTFDPGRD